MTTGKIFISFPLTPPIGGYIGKSFRSIVYNKK